MPQQLHKNQTLRMEVESISSDGNGVGRVDGRVVFVPYAAVGDVLDVRLVKVNKSHAYAIISQMVTAGPQRIATDCPISGKCGGCAFRHLSYAAELEAKRGFVAQALLRIGGIKAEVPACLPSPQVNRYRNKAQYPVAPGAGGQPVYGFYAPRSHRVVPCEDCLLQPQPVNAMAQKAAALLAELGAVPYDEATGKGLLRHLYLRCSQQSGQVLLCLVLTADRLPHADRFASEMQAAFPQLAGIVLNFNPARTNVILGQSSRLLAGRDTLDDALCGVPVRLGIHSFAQVNTPAASQLFELAAAYAAPGPNDTLLDLYCGTGVIGLSMAARAGQLIGVEVVAPALAAARQSAEAMGLANTRFLCADAAQATAQLAAEGLRAHIVIVDPPRKGADQQVIDALLAMAPRRIVMISCNPATLARDLALLAAGGYILKQLQPADLFPRTRHVECVCLLEPEHR